MPLVGLPCAAELARLTISCCAADARAARVRLQCGRVVSGSATPAEHYVPGMVVRGVEVVPTPPDPYEY